MKINTIFVAFATVGLILTSCVTEQNELTRGIGVYPGNPAEDFSPELKTGNTSYRNLALLRAAYHSSSYDYNLTSQLITDGIISREIPSYISIETTHGMVPKNEREWLIDHVTGSAISIEGNDIWVKYEIGGDKEVPEIDRIAFNGDITYDENKPLGWDLSLYGSYDGIAWDLLDREKGPGLPGFKKPNFFEEMMKNLPKDSTGKTINPFADFFAPPDPNEPKPSFTFNFSPSAPIRALEQNFELKKAVSYRFYKVRLNTPCASSVEIGDFNFFSNEKQIEMAPSYHFSSAWMSAGTEDEWVYVDLGASSTIDMVNLNWILKATSGSIQVSNDAINWIDIAELPDSEELIDEICLEKPVTGRYVRLVMKNAKSKKGFILSEMEVMGTGGLIAVPTEYSGVSKGKLHLAGGTWKIQRASQVSAGSETISTTGFNANDWLIATVPGTVLMSYRNAGALPDPNYSDNQLMISESFFNADFWYRKDFTLPSDFDGKRVYLNFDGINWKADVYMNGKTLGKIEGAFTRAKFDISNLLSPDGENTIAVLIRKNDNSGAIKEQTAIHPDKNGGILGGDNPTFHASVGWDWIPTIRGRNIGIWNDVHLSTSEAVTIEDPFVVSDLPLPDTSAADIHIELSLLNHSAKTVTGTLFGNFGDIQFQKEVSLEANKATLITLDPSDHPSLHIQDPKLWWPKGYGQANLYDVELRFTINGKVSDQIAFKSGVREMSFDEKDNILSIYINGRRFIGQGGNWGFSESNLNYRAREYDIAVAYHADMNFTMIRNWVGQIGDDEFYEACDRHGIMVWQDFWLANPVDGPNPYNPTMFMDNAEDMIKRIRNHPSIAIYVGRNEGFPPEVLDTALRTLIPEIHPGIHYISNSSMGVVSGGGPYRALPPRDYYLIYGRDKLHSERGMPNVMTYESLAQTLPDSKLWPQNSQWGLHDYCLEGAQGAASFNDLIETGFGPATDAKMFTELAQWINYDGYRSMFEGRSQYRRGLLLWMSHSAWPSMVWQTYDYYFEPTAAYFGCKKACEPIHIQWNPVYDSIEVVNYNAGDLSGLVAQSSLINMDGSVQWEKEASLDSNEDTTEKLFKLDFPDQLSSTHFIKLILKQEDKILSENFYWRGIESGNYQALNELPKVNLETSTSLKRKGDQWLMETVLQNTTDVPILMIRLKITDKTSGERILPALYSDNYISLMPGESKVIHMSVKKEDSRGHKPTVEVSGFNII